jgi:predicted thioesterase
MANGRCGSFVKQMSRAFRKMARQKLTQDKTSVGDELHLLHARISTADQDLTAQIEAPKAAGATTTFRE